MTSHQSDLELKIARALNERADSLSRSTPTTQSDNDTSGTRTAVSFDDPISPHQFVPLVEADTSTTLPQYRRRLLAAVAVLVVVVATVALALHDGADSSGSFRAGGSGVSPSSSTPGLQCAVNGVSPDGKTRGTAPKVGPPPDFLPVTSNRHIVGYMSSTPPSGSGDSLPVYGCDLTTLVGHLVANKGFIPLGVDPATVATLVPSADTQHTEKCLLDQKPITC